MRLVIADDEPLLRYHLRSLVSEVDSSVELLEAENGLELVNLARRGLADAAFVDIRMPKLDGLGAMERLKGMGIALPWAILSSHSEFGYAKRALEMGALGYVLKPPSSDEIGSLLPILGGAVRKSREERSQGFVRLWAGMEPESGQKTGSLPMRSGIYIHDGPHVPPDVAERALADGRNRLLAASIPGRYPGSHELLCAVEGGSPEGADALLAAFLKTFLAAVRKTKGDREGGRALCIISDIVDSIPEARERLPPMRELLDYRALLPSGVLEHERAAALLFPFSSVELMAAKETVRLIRNAEREDRNVFSTATVDLQAALSGVDPSVRRRLIRYLEQTLGRELGSGLTGKEDWKSPLRTGLSTLFREPGTEGNTIESVKAYLLRHYSQRLTLAETAVVFALSPNYLSTLFHGRTGKTFLEYLTELRLERGRELLWAGKSVKECAWAVGYGSERHFAQLYRRRFGYPPASEKLRWKEKS